MIEQKEVVISSKSKGELTYRIHQLDGWKGISVGRKILKVIGPALVTLFGQEGEGKGVQGAMDIFVEHIDEFDDDLIRTLMGTVTRGGYAIKVEEEFKGNYWALVKLLQEVIWHNFEDLFTQGLLAGSEEE